jgi:hypothetical protein
MCREALKGESNTRNEAAAACKSRLFGSQQPTRFIDDLVEDMLHARDDG